MLKQVKDVPNFMNVYQTCNIRFDEKVPEFSPETRKSKLVDVCRTRWVDRIEGLGTCQELFVPVFRTLEHMEANTDGQYNPSLSGDTSSVGTNRHLVLQLSVEVNFKLI